VAPRRICGAAHRRRDAVGLHGRPRRASTRRLAALQTENFLRITDWLITDSRSRRSACSAPATDLVRPRCSRPPAFALRQWRGSGLLAKLRRWVPCSWMMTGRSAVGDTNHRRGVTGHVREIGLFAWRDRQQRQRGACSSATTRSSVENIKQLLRGTVRAPLRRERCSSRTEFDIESALAAARPTR
jgi:hypothetical protein